MLYLLFQLGHDRYALPARDVVEVLPYLALPPIPRAAPGVAGLCNYRGRPVPVLDLCALLCDRPAHAVLSTRIIIVKAGEPSAPDSLLGLIAERATGTLRRDPGVLPAPPTGPAAPPALGRLFARPPWLGPVLLDERGVIQLLHADRLLTVTDREQLNVLVRPSPPTPPLSRRDTTRGGRTVGGEGEPLMSQLGHASP